MFVLASCEAEVHGDLLALSFFVVAAYALWLWAAVLRRPGDVGGKPYVTLGLGLLVGVPLMWPAASDLYLHFLLLAACLGAAIAAAVSFVARWPHRGRLIAAGVLGSLTPAVLLTLLFTIGIGSGGFCFD